MKKTLLAPIIGISLLLGGCFSKPHAQFSSRIDQIASHEPQAIHLEADGIVDGMKSVWGDKGAEVEIAAPGTYLVMWAPQVALVDEAKRGCFVAWLQVNEENIPDSGVKTCIPPGPEATYVLMGQYAGNFEIGDVIRPVMTGINTKTKFYPEDGVRRRVDVPSVIFTVVKL